MDALQLMKHFRLNAGQTARYYTHTYVRYPDKSSILRFTAHYINEANSKIGLLEEIIMPKMKGNFNAGTVKFCAISLDTEGKAKARLWLDKHGKDLDTFAVQMVRDGWKSTFSWDDYNDCFIASATCKDERDANFDICCTSRSDNMWDAMLLNYYKIYVLYKDTILPTEREKSNWG
jgi:hypothetical protein